MVWTTGFDLNRTVVAHVSRGRRSTLDVLADAAVQISLQFEVPPTQGLSQTSCPTFQVGGRYLLSHPDLSEACVMTGTSSAFSRECRSHCRARFAVLHGLSQGKQRAAHYLTRARRDDESAFAISKAGDAHKRELAIPPYRTSGEAGANP